MDMEKIMAYVEKIAENLEGLVCAIGCDSTSSEGAIYVDGAQRVNYISTKEALRILDGFGNNSASVMIGKSDYIPVSYTHLTSTERCFTEMKTGFLILTGSNRIVRKTKDFLDLG